ncbi:MAG: sulfur carrier protein ThiS [Gammaproteobacteria bacterium]
MQLSINGEPRDVSGARTVAELLIALGLGGRLAVEINGDIVPRGRYGEHRLYDNDVVEIVRAIGGG